MGKLLVVFLIALSTYKAFGQQAPDSTFTTQSPQIRQCLISCPTTSQYNPVCGTDLITYDNIGRLRCAQFCGVSVDVLIPNSRCSIDRPNK